MNSGESSGESSSCGRENGAALSDPERPHKKARFPWQIKGKYHLKNQTNEVTESPAATLVEPEPLSPSPESVASMSNKISIDSNSASEASEASKDTDRLIGQGSGPPLTSDGFQSVITRAESMLMWSRSGTSNHYNTARNAENTFLELDLEVGPSSSINLAREARRLKREEDKLIYQWQAAQNVRGCFDNTINSVLDSWINASRPAEDTSIGMRFAGILNVLAADDENVENEAILMAINAHGLQNVPTVAGIPVIAPSEQLARTLASDIPICEDSDSSLGFEDYEYGEESCSPWPMDAPDTRNVNQYQQSDKESDNVVHPWRQVRDNRHANQPTPYQYRDNSNNTTGEDYDYEFMNTAVIQAIKNKGLMAAGTDFG